MADGGAQQGGEVKGGLPIQCVVRVRPPSQGESRASKVQIDGKFVRLSGEVYSVVEAHGASASAEEVYGKELKRLARAATDGLCACVLILGQSGSGKTHLLLGDPGATNGLAVLAVRDLFEGLKRSQAQAPGSAAAASNASGGRQHYEGRTGFFRVGLQCVEVCNDSVADIVGALNGSASVRPVSDLETEWAATGPMLCGMSTLDLRHPQEFAEALSRCVEARTRASSEFGPLRSRASFFVSLEVEQRLPSSQETLLSRLTFAILPSTERLAEDPDVVRSREGPRLNRELLALGAFLRQSSAGASDMHTSALAASTTTTLLEEALGGNCVTFCVAMLAPHDVTGSKTTLEAMRALGQIVCSPVRNDERVTSVLGRLARKLTQMRARVRQLEVGANPADAAVSRQVAEEQERAIVELKSRLIKSDLDRGKLLRDKEQLTDKFNGFKEKYALLAKAKADVQAELVRSEEERLRVSKLLVELQIENTDIRERSETEKFDLEAKLLAMENDVVQREDHEQKHREEKAALQKQLEEALAEKKDLSVEYVTLRQNYSELATEHETLKQRSEELGAELLSLVNARSALSRELEQLHRELDSQKKASKELSDFKGRADERERLAREQLDAARGEAESLKVQLVKKDVELAKTVSEFESLKAGLERGFVQMAAERDAQVRSATQGLDAARAELAHRTDELTKDAQRLATELKLAQRRVEELEALAGEQALQVSEQSAKLEAANQQAEASAEAFRSKLLQLMAQVQELTTGVVSHPESEAELHSVGDESAPVTAVVGASRRDGEERPDEAAAKPVLDKLWKEILQTHRERERSLLDAADQERRVVQQLRRQIRELAARVQTLQRFAQDVAPAGVTAPVLDDKELATLASVPPDALERKRQQDEQLIRSLQQQLDQQKQLLLAQAETFQRNSSRLQREHSRMSEEFATLQRIHAKCGQTVDQQVLEDHKKALDELRSFLERKLRDQVEDLKASADRAAQGREEVFRLKDRVEALKTENESLKERLRTSSAEEIDRLRRDYEERLKRAAEEATALRQQLSQAQSLPSGGLGVADAMALRKQMKEFQENSLKQLERERSTLKARLIQAEEELRSLQAYMQAEVLAYQKEIARLRTENDQLRGAAPNRSVAATHS